MRIKLTIKVVVAGQVHLKNVQLRNKDGPVIVDHAAVDPHEDDGNENHDGKHQHHQLVHVPLQL